jgi:hypothetical protein
MSRLKNYVERVRYPRTANDTLRKGTCFFITVTVKKGMSEPFKALVPIDTGIIVPVPLPKMDPALLAKLAAEVARDQRDIGEILTDYNLTLEQFNYLKTNAFFARVLETATIEWNSDLSVHDRLRVEAAMYLEQGMPVLGARMLNEREELKDAVETAKMFAKVAGLGEVGDKSSSGEKFTINIDLGGDKTLRLAKTITIEPSAKEGAAADKPPSGRVL